MEHKARVFGQPGLYLLALVHPYIIEHHMNGRDSRGNLPIHLLQKHDEFHLPFPFGRGGVDFPRARIKPSKQVQRAFADILVFDPHGSARLGGQGRGFAGPGLQTGFLVDAQHHFPDTQGACIEGHNLR